MIPIQIHSEDELKSLLEQHTGSPKLVWDVRGVITPSYIQVRRERYYLAYSRGKSTMMFKKDTSGSFLLDIIPKRICRPGVEGIDAAMMVKIQNLINAGGRITSWYRGFMLELPQPLLEFEILDMLRAGWTDYYDFPRSQYGPSQSQLRMCP
jgi:hypothetical protein